MIRKLNVPVLLILQALSFLALVCHREAMCNDRDHIHCFNVIHR